MSDLSFFVFLLDSVDTAVELMHIDLPYCMCLNPAAGSVQCDSTELSEKEGKEPALPDKTNVFNCGWKSLSRCQTLKLTDLCPKELISNLKLQPRHKQLLSCHETYEQRSYLSY